MSRFVLKCIDSVKGKQSFQQVITVDCHSSIEKQQNEIYQIEYTNTLIDKGELEGEKTNIIPGVLDTYEDALEAKYASSFRTILTYMNLVADLQTIPPNKFKYLAGHGDKIKEFEFKAGDLRVYGIDIFAGKLIMFCGYKNEQPKNIIKFRAIKKHFLETYDIKKLENEKRRINTKQ